MNASTRAMLQARIEELSRQVVAETAEIRRRLDLTKKLVDEMNDANAALRAIFEEDVRSDSAEGLVSEWVAKTLNSESKFATTDDDSTTSMVNKSRVGRAQIRPGTIKADVVNILRRHPDGLIALDILKLLNETRERPIERTSLSPQLTRLGRAGHIQRRGSLWFIPSRNVAEESSD